MDGWMDVCKTNSVVLSMQYLNQRDAAVSVLTGDRFPAERKEDTKGTER
jgi:hypothetical protein